MKNFLQKRSTMAYTATGIAMVSVMAFVGLAGATTYDPTSALTGFASTATATGAPIVVAVAGGLITLAIVFWAISFVFGFFGKKRRA